MANVSSISVALGRARRERYSRSRTAPTSCGSSARQRANGDDREGRARRGGALADEASPRWRAPPARLDCAVMVDQPRDPGLFRRAGFPRHRRERCPSPASIDAHGDSLGILRDHPRTGCTARSGGCGPVSIPEIARVSSIAVTASFRRGGRLLYVGGGNVRAARHTRRRRVPADVRHGSRTRFVGIIAGGRESVFRAQEGAEDDAEAGAARRRRPWSGPERLRRSASPRAGALPMLRGALEPVRVRSERSRPSSRATPGDDEAGHRGRGGRGSGRRARGHGRGLDAHEGRHRPEARPEHDHDRLDGPPRQDPREPDDRSAPRVPRSSSSEAGGSS